MVLEMSKMSLDISFSTSATELSCETNKTTIKGEFFCSDYSGNGIHGINGFHVLLEPILFSE